MFQLQSIHLQLAAIWTLETEHSSDGLALSSSGVTLWFLGKSLKLRMVLLKGSQACLIEMNIWIHKNTSFTCIPSKVCLACNSKDSLNISTALVVVRPSNWNSSCVKIYTNSDFHLTSADFKFIHPNFTTYRCKLVIGRVLSTLIWN